MELLSAWMSGNLPPAARILGALAPGGAALLYFGVAALAYAVRVLRRGPFHDTEIEGRGSSFLLSMPVRRYFAWSMQPIWRITLFTRLPPDSLTTLSVLLAAIAGVAFSAGRFTIGGWVFLAAGACDFLDGRLARAQGAASRAGSALDSVLDRYSDSIVWIGLAWYYRESWVLLAVLLALMGTSLVPYIRAKGEALGQNVTVGLMQRPERTVVLGLSTALSPALDAWLDPFRAHPTHYLAVVAIVIIAAGTQLTAATRVRHLLNALKGNPPRTWMGLQQGGPVRNLVAALVATGMDFAFVLFLVSKLDLPAWLATAVGCVFGGGVNFAVNRIWTFASHGPRLTQASRYVLVSTTSALLNSAGVAALLLLPHIDYRFCWVLVRLAVWLGWNYPLHRDYVFDDDHLKGTGPGVDQPVAPDALDVGTARG
jgi:phosphatidylglycerophosphate synthase/putative flippase GtrA